MLLQIIFPLLLAAFIFLWWISRRKSNRKNGLPFPPGPPAELIIGHLRKLPKEHIENYFYELSKEYG